MMHRTLCLLLVAASVATALHGEWANLEVGYAIDLSTQRAHHTLTIELANSGDLVASVFVLAVPASEARHLAFAGVKEKEESLTLTPCAPLDGAPSDATFYEVDLGHEVAPEEAVTVVVDLVFTHTMTPLPAEIGQSDRQLVVFTGNLHFFSPYQTGSETVKVTLPSRNVEEYTTDDTTELTGETLTYGPYEDMDPYTLKELRVHFESYAGFAVITHLLREIEVSHWGNVAVEDTVDMIHEGAKLRGPWSRYDYQRNPSSYGANAVRDFHVTLPYLASDYYYRDEIGNISTSRYTQMESGVDLNLIPRFPLFGGWKTTFYYGYNLPAQYFLSTNHHNSAQFILNVTFADVWRDTTIDKATVKVILPEGASDIETFAPFDIESTTFEKRVTYLDTTGRPVLVLTKKNVVHEHAVYFQVSYNFSLLSMLREPFFLITGFLAFFLACMVYVRIKSIGVVSQEGVYDIVKRLGSVHDELTKVYGALEYALLKSSSRETLDRAQTRLEENIAKCACEITKIGAELGTLNPSLAEKTRELQRLEEERTKAYKALLKLHLKAHPPADQIAKAQALYETAKDRATRKIHEILEDF